MVLTFANRDVDASNYMDLQREWIAEYQDVEAHLKANVERLHSDPAICVALIDGARARAYLHQSSAELQYVINRADRFKERLARSAKEFNELQDLQAKTRAKAEAIAAKLQRVRRMRNDNRLCKSTILEKAEKSRASIDPSRNELLAFLDEQYQEVHSVSLKQPFAYTTISTSPSTPNSNGKMTAVISRINNFVNPFCSIANERIILQLMEILIRGSKYGRRLPAKVATEKSSEFLVFIR
ncbi:hypothetical protein EC973_009096 [Apophysomyces ossiformis]|uniref:Uncharacterized protein n=1 Tax=Apophysomyces ossiformis TaxID=679940 RepID=A0A8H7EQJ5_9FUNG|nr:hypothetical protein EC973_009096 [Apophysomyces ossiformis]